MVAPLLVLPVLVAGVFLQAPRTECRFERLGDPARDELALGEFTARVQSVVEVHRRLERPMAGAWIVSDPMQLEVSAAALRDAIRHAWPAARPGTLFTPAVADVFRHRIRQNLRASDFNPGALAGDGEDGWADPVPVAVNEPLPWGLPTAVLPFLLETLPGLPPELEYRFAGRALVVLDLRAGLVVDVLDLVLPAP